MQQHGHAENILKLRSMLAEKSIRHGNFTLVSGATSNIYIDGKLTTCSAEAMPLIGQVFLQRLRDKGWFPEAVGGLTIGAEPIAFAIARESLETGQAIDVFIVRKEPKPHGRHKLIEGLEPTEGRRVVIIDDVCSKGGSTGTAIENARAEGMEVIGAICLVDREMGATELLADKYGLQLESIFKLSEFQAGREDEIGAAKAPVGAHS